MRRRTPMHAAVGSAFAGSNRRTSADGAQFEDRRLQIHPAALAFVAGFPGAVGSLALVAALSRSVADDGAVPLGVGTLVLAGILLVLGLLSALRIGHDDVSVRFFGLRSTTIRFDELASATFGMSFPSISYGIALTDRDGRKALIHANWWRDESAVIRPVCRALVNFSVPMDRSTARIVSRVLGVKRPNATIFHRPWLKNGRTW